MKRKIPMKEKWYQIAAVGCILAVTTLANYSIYLANRLGEAEKSVEIANLRVKVNDDWTNEIIFSHLNGIQGQTKDMLIEQGRLQGIVQLMEKGEYDDTFNVWHEGYQRGLNQGSDFADMEYERGYHAAMKQTFPEHPTVNSSPREVKEDAIKTPSFDESTGSTLPDIKDEIDLLNLKIENLFEPEDK